MSGNELSHHELEIVHLCGLDLDGLRQRWRSEFGRKPPSHLPKHLLMRILAYRCQSEALGDLSRATKLFLDDVARAVTTKGAAATSIAVVSERKRLSPGTVLMREHGGQNQQVTVTVDGFAWNGTTYPSLTKVAFAITGTRWNGPLFFGLRGGATETQP